MATHTCIRIYANGSAKYTVRDDAGLASWLDRNVNDRPGNSLFVDGDHIEGTGYLEGEQLEQVSKFVLEQAIENPQVRRAARTRDPDSGKVGMFYPEDDVLVSDWRANDFTDTLRKQAKPARGMSR